MSELLDRLTATELAELEAFWMLDTPEQDTSDLLARSMFEGLRGGS